MSESKSVLRFRTEMFGLFIDLGDDGTIGVNRRNGEILLDEGDGLDCYHGAIIRSDNFRQFFLKCTDGVSAVFKSVLSA